MQQKYPAALRRLRRGLGRCALSGAAALGLDSAAFAGDAATPPPMAFSKTELRLGIFAHDPAGPESGAALNGEVLFPKWFEPGNAWTLVVPRLHFGGTVSLSGNTSTAYAGFAWSYDVTPRIFVEAALGGAMHNGDTRMVPAPGRDALGCSPLFREAASLGYRFTDAVSIMATVEHHSNAGLCSHNRGLTNAGLRIGHSF